VNRSTIFENGLIKRITQVLIWFHKRSLKTASFSSIVNRITIWENGSVVRRTQVLIGLQNRSLKRLVLLES